MKKLFLFSFALFFYSSAFASKGNDDPVFVVRELYSYPLFKFDYLPKTPAKCDILKKYFDSSLIDEGCTISFNRIAGEQEDLEKKFPSVNVVLISKTDNKAIVSVSFALNKSYQNRVERYKNFVFLKNKKDGWKITNLALQDFDGSRFPPPCNYQFVGDDLSDKEYALFSKECLKDWREGPTD